MRACTSKPERNANSAMAQEGQEDLLHRMQDMMSAILNEDQGLEPKNARLCAIKGFDGAIKEDPSSNLILFDKSKNTKVAPLMASPTAFAPSLQRELLSLVQVPSVLRNLAKDHGILTEASCYNCAIKLCIYILRC